MSARDVIALWLDDYVGSRDVVGLKSDADAILTALSKARYEVLSTGAIHKALQDAFQAGGVDAVNTLQNPTKFISAKHKYCDKALNSLMENKNAE